MADNNQLILNYVLDTRKVMEKLPKNILGRGASFDDFDYGSEASLGALLKEAQAFSKGRENPEPVRRD